MNDLNPWAANVSEDAELERDYPAAVRKGESFI
jgi:hypothetical protein